MIYVGGQQVSKNMLRPMNLPKVNVGVNWTVAGLGKSYSLEGTANIWATEVRGVSIDISIGQNIDKYSFKTTVGWKHLGAGYFWSSSGSFEGIVLHIPIFLIPKPVPFSMGGKIP